MAIPLSYNLRNLVVRKTTTALTAAGIGLTAAVLMSVMALTAGLRASLEASGHPLQLIITRKGATSEMTSLLPRQALEIVRTMPGIARDGSGALMVSLELITGVTLGSRDEALVTNVTLRGMPISGLALRPQLRLAEGRMFEPGRREIVVGRTLAQRQPHARLGRRVEFGRGTWTVVGILDGGRSMGNNEIYADLNQVSAAFNRVQTVSSILVRVSSPADIEPLRAALEADRRIIVQAQPELDYYRSQMTSAAPVRFMGLLVAALLAIGSSVAAMNTMYAAVARRQGEIGTLRVLGFSRGSVLASFLAESAMLGLLGGLLGWGMVLPLNDAGASMSSLSTFTEFSFQFRVAPTILGAGLAFGVVMGAAGGLLPAWNAARKEALAALRAVA